MTNNQKPDQIKLTRRPNGRRTIGLLITNVIQPWERRQWLGVVDAARERNVNLLCFAGEALRHPDGFNAQRNVLYDLVDKERMDGLVIWLGGFDRFINQEEREGFCKHFGLPAVGVEGVVKGIPSVLMDDYQAMCKAIQHLIEVHGYKRIAFIAQPVGHNMGVKERYRAYIDTLAEYSLPGDPSWVIAGEEGLDDWLSGGQISDVEAVVAHNDQAALKALRKLQLLGIKVPGNVAVMGYNDGMEARMVTPPLTTVQPPFYEMAQQAVEMVLAMIAGEKVPESVFLPSKLIVRESCGCLSPEVTEAAARLQAVAEPAKSSRKKLEHALIRQQKEIVAGMEQAMREVGGSIDPTWAGQLLDGFTAELAGKSTGIFLAALNKILYQAVAYDGVSALHRMLSALRRNTLPYLDDKDLSMAEDLWQQARVVIGKTAERTQAYLNLQVEQQKRLLNKIGTDLATNFDLNDLTDILVKKLPSLLGISRGYLSLYEDPQSYCYPEQAPQWSRLVLAYDEENSSGSSRVEIEPGGWRFPSRQLVPPEILQQQGSYILIVQALYFQDEQIGFMLLDGNLKDGDIYDTLCTQISSTLKGALLIEQAQKHAEQIDTIVTETLTTSEEMQATISESSRQAQAVSMAAQASMQVSKTGRDAVAKAVAGMETIQNLVSDIAQSILTLSERVQQVEKILSAVEEIVSQSKILAINTSILAARANKKGLGFEIIAREMRALAEQSSEATTKISSIINEIQSSANTAVMVTEDGSKGAQHGMDLANRAGEVIQELTATIEEAAQLAVQIATGSIQQTDAMNQLVMSMKEIKEASMKTSSNSKDTGL